MLCSQLVPQTVITDYPDKALIDNIQFNVDTCIPDSKRSDVTVLVSAARLQRAR